MAAQDAMTICPPRYLSVAAALSIVLGVAQLAAQTVRTVDADGFLQRWVLLEPIKVAGQLTESAVREAAGKEYFPDQMTGLPRDGDTVTVFEEPHTWHIVNTPNYNVNLYHF